MRSLNLLLVAATALMLVYCGCSGRQDPRADLVDLAGVPVPADWRDHVDATLDLLADTAADAPYGRAVSTYYDLHRDIGNPDTRQAAGDSLFAFWRDDPTNFLWIELAAHKSRILGRKDDRNIIYGQLPDTTTAVGGFLRARRFWGFKPGAGEHFKQAWQRRAELDSLQTLWLATRVAMLDSDRGSNDEAVALLREWLPAAGRLGGLSMTGFYWSVISRYLEGSGRLDMALHAASLSLACAEADGHHYMMQMAWQAVGRILVKRREYEPALEIFNESYRASRAAGYTRWAGDAAHRCADIHMTLGDRDSVLAHHRRALEIVTTSRDTTYMIYLTGFVAGDHRRMGQMDSCRSYLQRGDTYLEVWPNVRNRLGQTHQWASYFSQLGDYARADSLYSAVADIIGEGGYFDDMATVQLGLLRQGLETGRPDLAYRALARSRDMRNTMHTAGAAYDKVADLELAAAVFLAQQGEFRRASMALAAADSLIGPEGSVGMKWSLEAARGETALIAGDLITAARNFGTAVDLAGTLGNPDVLARSRVQLGHVLLALERLDEARSLFERDGTGGGYWSRLAGHLFSGMTAALAENHETALVAYRRAEQMLRPQSPRDLVARLRLEQGRSLAALGRHEEAFAVLSRARDLLQVQGDRYLAEEYRAFHRNASRDLAELRIDLLYDHPELAGRHDAVLEALAYAEACRWRVDPGALTCTAAELAEMIPLAGEPVLVFFVGRERSFVWTGSVQGWELRELSTVRELKRLVAAVISDTGQAGVDVSKADAKALGELLLGSAAAYWHRDRVLRIVSDGLLADLPWSALRLDTFDSENELVVEFGPVAEAPDVRAAVRDAASPPGIAAARMLAIGADDPGAGGHVLQHAEQEARAVAAGWSAGDVEVLTGAAARWSGLIDDLSGFEVIHIASHATVTQGLPGHSTLRLAGGDQEEPITIPTVRDLELNADLVYLSSCEAARLGVDTGSGLNSFARAFLQAGAQRVVAPNVRVEDAAARYLAESFYHHRRDGKNWAAALRSAQLDVRSADPRWRHPYYWAFTRLLVSGSQ